MTSITSMWTTFEASIPGLEDFVIAFAYVLGLGFIIYGITQLHDLPDRYTKHNVKGGMFEVVAYFLGGGLLLWLPSWIDVFETTLFGTDSPLAYSNYIINSLTPFQSLSSYVVTETLELVGIIFFVRGVSLMALSSAPGVQHGARGLVFMIAGIFSINFPATFEFIKSTVYTFVTTKHSLYPIQQTLESYFQ